MPLNKLLYISHAQTFAYAEGALGEASGRETKEFRSGAVVPLSLLNIHTLKLPNHLSNEEQKILVEIRMFEEGNLDSNEEYTIAYVRYDLPGENSHLFEAFALSHAKAADYFSAALARSKTIDLIVPGIMVYGSVYDTDALPGRNDLFLYFGENESYAAIYQNGHYIAHRSLESLAALAAECGYESETLISVLSERGVIEENYPPEESAKCLLIQDALSRNVERLVHTINHKRGLFGLTEIDRIYLDFRGDTIPGLESVFEAYGIQNAPLTPLSKPQSPSTELHDLLCAEYLAKHIEDAPFNLSPFERQAPRYKRESGKFLGIMAASLLVALFVPLGISWQIADETRRKTDLTETLGQIEGKSAELASVLSKRTQQFEKTRNAVQELNREIEMVRGSRETADLIAQMHLKRQQMLLDVTSELGRYRLGTLSMEQNGSKGMALHVVAEYRKRDDIAKLMSGLYARGYQNVETDEITLENDTYNAVVKVTR